MPGPLCADSDEIAELLTSHAIKNFQPARDNGFLFVTLSSNAGAMAMAAKLKLSGGEFPRFFTQRVVEADFSKIYAIASPNFSPF